MKDLYRLMLFVFYLPLFIVVGIYISVETAFSRSYRKFILSLSPDFLRQYVFDIFIECKFYNDLFWLVLLIYFIVRPLIS